MSIPYYDDLYRFPGGYPCQQHEQGHYPGHDFHHKPMPKPDCMESISKSINICDKFHNIRYIVALQSQMFYNGRFYKVSVSQMLPEGPVVFLELPEDGWYDNYKPAIEDFYGCVSRYQSLVNAEMKDFRNIEVYKDEIDYKVQKLRCCDTCKWCMKTLERYDQSSWACEHGKRREKVIKRQCCSPDNEQVFNHSQQYPQLPHYHKESSWQKLPWQSCKNVNFGKPTWDPRKFPSIIFPVVNQMGICDNYMAGECDYNIVKKRKSPIQRLADTIASEYTTYTSCMPGDLVYYCDKLYECISAHPGGKWDKNHFKFTTVEDELMSKATPDGVSSMISDALVDYTTYSNVQDIVEANLVPYAKTDDLSAYAISSDVSAMLSGYVSTNALSSTTMPSNPTQHQMADVVKAQLEILGGKVE